MPVVSLALPLLLLVQRALPPARTLAGPQHEFAEPFTQIDGVHELRDGRVIVLDSRDRALQLVDLVAGRAVMVGRQGEGPGEYRLPLRLFALPGDSTAVYDLANARRLLLVGPAGEPGGFIATADGAGGMPFSAEATDGQGRIYAMVRLIRQTAAGTTLSADSAGIGVDAIGADGRIVQRLVLPKQTRLLGFGRDAMYLARSDADDLQYVGRYRPPLTRGGMP